MKTWFKIIPIFLLFFFSSIVSVSARSGCCSYYGGVCGCGCCDGTPLSSTCAPYYPECGGGYEEDYSNTYDTQPSCPLMSTYNSATGQCECMSGYIASGNSCISAYQWCSNKYGYNAEYDSLSQSCKCRYGYTWNSSQTSCISEDQACQNQFGYNSKATISGNKCECKYGYVWNKSGNKCITQDVACQELNGLMSRYNSLNDKCECFSGYVYDGSECVLDTSTQVYYYPTPTIIPTRVPTKKPTPIIKQSPTITVLPTPTINVDDLVKNLNNSANNTSPQSFWQKLLNWFFGGN